MKKPLLTVCLITYNHASYIRQAIDSALEQHTDFAWQLVIADDFSSDGTREILLDYKKKHPEKIHLILQKKNVGAEQNWLDLINYPQTKYMLYGEGDDYFTDNTKLQRQVDFLESHPDYALCFHPVTVSFEHSERDDFIYPADKSGFTLEKLLQENYMQTNTVVFRRQSYKDFPRGIVPGDWYLHIYHAQFGKIGFINRVMSVYRRHKGSTWWDTYDNQEQIWLKHGMGQVAMFNEALIVLGKSKTYARILHGHVAYLLTQFIDLDRKYDSQLFDQAIARFPALVKEFAIGQLDNIRELDRQRSHNAAMLMAAQARLAKIERKIAPLRKVDPRRAKKIYYRLKRTR